MIAISSSSFTHSLTFYIIASEAPKQNVKPLLRPKLIRPVFKIERRRERKLQNPTKADTKEQHLIPIDSDPSTHIEVGFFRVILSLLWQRHKYILPCSHALVLLQDVADAECSDIMEITCNNPNSSNL
ncbi:hypothetical protein M9H77_22567 [Catharanthus roseus]|uniref:Uncharacterized protein n=1 Tax=Catharanthus roseus TaxID=4058 RepID=A0ACC0ARS6_CATRO|nr:hypothetical protein M9H77_22567 [Catharanthus roseus]